MKIELAYIAVSKGKATHDFAQRFVSTYRQFPGGEPHTLTVVCNGGPLPENTGRIFDGLGARFVIRQNTPGWDLDGFRHVAAITDADMLVCLGESVHFRRSGWLTRLRDAWERHGPGMYGPWGSHSVRAHLNTTAFACPPKFLADFPATFNGRKDRYEFEHGPNAFWRWMHAKGHPVMLVTWDGEWLPGQWRVPPNILWRGDQSNCIMFCTHTDRYETATPEVRKSWAQFTDRPYK